MKDTILKLLRRRRGDNLNARQIAHHLGLASGQHRNLRHDLKSLINEGKLLVDRNQRYAARDENRVLKGTVRLHWDGFGFLTPEDRKKEDVFVPRRHLNSAMNGDTVLVESSRGGDDRYEGRVIQVVARANTTVVGTLKTLGDQHFVVIRDPRLGLAELYVPKKNLNKAAEGDFVAAKISQYPGHGIVPVGEVVHVIGVESDESSLKEAALIKRGIVRKFPEAVKHALESLPAEVDGDSVLGREDLRDLPIITIDGVTARDFDDAVCALKRGKTTVLWVSIADVAEYVGIGSALDKEAYRRGTSTYLPDECVPMLPEKLSNGLCSLNPHVPRLTLTAELHYGADGGVTKARFYRSVIRSVKRATYDEVQAYFNGTGGADMPLAVRNSLDTMKTIAETLIRRADKRGTLGFDLPEAEFLFDGKGDVASIRKRPRFFSHRLIEQFMVGANVAVAQVFSLSGLPLLYRIHGSPDPAKMQTFLDMAQGMGVAGRTSGFHPADFFKSIVGQPLETFLQTSFLRSLKQAVYSPDNIGHYGLALKDYAHFTSPIRRYPDLIVHRQLRALLEQTPGGVLEFDPRREVSRGALKNPRLSYSFPDLMTIGDTASKRERDSMEAEREVADIKRAVFMRSHLRAKFFGTITRVTRVGISVELEPHFVEGFLPLKDMHDDYYIFDEHKFRLTGRRNRVVLSIGDKLYVEVSDVDETTARIGLKLAREIAPRGKKGRR